VRHTLFDEPARWLLGRCIDRKSVKFAEGRTCPWTTLPDPHAAMAKIVNWLVAICDDDIQRETTLVRGRSRRPAPGSAWTIPFSPSAMGLRNRGNTMPCTSRVDACISNYYSSIFNCLTRFPPRSLISTCILPTQVQLLSQTLFRRRPHTLRDQPCPKRESE
jgi:hypothetical protein